MKRIGVISTAFLFAVLGLNVAAYAQDQKEPEKHEEAKPEKAPKPEKPAKPEKHDDKPQQQHDQDKGAKEAEHQQDQQRKDQEKAAKDQQKEEDKARKDNDKPQRDQQKQNEEQQKAAQHEQDQQRKDDEHRNDQHANQPQPGRDDHRPDQPGAQRDDRRPDQPPVQANRPAPQPQRGNAGAQRATFQEHRARNWQSEHRTWQQRGGYHGYRIPDDRFRASFGEAHRFHLATVPVTVVEGFPRFQIEGFWFSLVDPWPEYWSDNWYDNDDCYIDYYDGGYYLEDVRYPGVRLAINVFIN